MTIFDYIIIAIVAVSVILGVWRGVVGEILALIAWGLAILAARWWGDEVANILVTVIAHPVLRLVAAWALIFIAVLILMALLRMAVSGLLKAIGLSPINRILGMVVGVVRGLLIVLLLVAVGGITMLPKERWWVEAYFSAPMETAVIASKPWLPPEVAQRIRFR